MFETQATAGRGLKETLLPPWTFNTGFLLMKHKCFFISQAALPTSPPTPVRRSVYGGGYNITGQAGAKQQNTADKIFVLSCFATVLTQAMFELKLGFFSFTVMCETDLCVFPFGIFKKTPSQ